MPNSTTNADQPLTLDERIAIVAAYYIIMLFFMGNIYTEQTKEDQNRFKDFIKQNPLVPFLAVVCSTGYLATNNDTPESGAYLTLLWGCVGAGCGIIAHQAANTPAFRRFCNNRRNEPQYRELVSQELQVVDPNMGVVSAGQPPAADTTTPTPSTTTPNPSANLFLA